MEQYAFLVPCTYSLEKEIHKHRYSIQFYLNVNNNYKLAKAIAHAVEILAFSHFHPISRKHEITWPNLEHNVLRNYNSCTLIRTEQKTIVS